MRLPALVVIAATVLMSGCAEAVPSGDEENEGCVTAVTFEGRRYDYLLYPKEQVPSRGAVGIAVHDSCTDNDPTAVSDKATVQGIVGVPLTQAVLETDGGAQLVYVGEDLERSEADPDLQALWQD